jgi:hypothetical protein
VIERFGRLPVPVRVALAAAGMALATLLDLTYIAKTSPWRIDVAIAAALGALAAWPFEWRARTRAQKTALIGVIAAFGAAMVWARLTGRINSSFAFLFSVLVLSVPVQRARGHREVRPDPAS